MSECDGRDGYMRMIMDRGEALQQRRERLRKATLDRVDVQMLAYVSGDIVTMRCGVYQLVYGITRVPGGLEATYLPLRSHPIPRIDPMERAILGAVVDAYQRHNQQRRV